MSVINRRRARLAALVVYGVWLGTGLLWGTTWLVIRVGLRDLPPLTFAALRTLVAGGALLAFAAVAVPERRPSGAELRFWLWLGLPQLGIPYALVFWAEQWISSGLTAMLFATVPAFTAIFSHLWLRDERLTPTRSLGTVLAIVAVIVLVGPRQGGATPPAAPVVGGLVAGIAVSLGAVVVRRHGRSTSTVWLTALQVGSAAIFLSLLALVFERGRTAHFTAVAVASILYLALAVTVGCYLGLFWLLKRLDATFVSMAVIFETAVAVFLGAALLGEPVGPRILGGLALVVVSVGLVSVGRVGGAAPAP